MEFVEKHTNEPVSICVALVLWMGVLEAYSRLSTRKQ